MDPNIVDWNGPYDPEKPSNWPLWRKWLITIFMGLATFTITFASSVFSTANHVTAELFGVKAALMQDEDGGRGQAQGLEPTEHAAASRESVANEADQVDALDRMMGQLLALQERAGDLPLAQRKRLAAKAVRDILKDNPGL